MKDSVDLVRRIRAGDAAAESEMVEGYSREVILLLRGLTRDRCRADDLYQETFRVALEKVRAGKLLDPTKLRAFVHQIARFQVRADRRRASRGIRDSEEQCEWVPDRRPSPLDRLLDKEAASLVHRTLACLEPVRDREILWRYCVAARPKEQVCDELGLSSLHFNRVLHRARGRLRSRVEALVSA